MLLHYVEEINVSKEMQHCASTLNPNPNPNPSFPFFTLLVLALSAIQASWRGHNQYLRALNLLFVFLENITFLYIPGVLSIGIVGIS